MTITGPAAGIDRDRWGRPLVVPPNGGKPVGYQRATTLAGMLEDTYKLGKWQQRMTALGLVDRPDLATAVRAHRDDKGALDDLCEQALSFAKAGAAAIRGTAMHAFCEKLDRGAELGPVTDDEQRDLDAYAAATKGMTHHHIEKFVVLDDLKVGGTPDRVTTLPDGRKVITDLKTGDTLDFGMGKIALQLALYAHGCLYDLETHERAPLGGVDQNVAVVIHLPAGQGMCTLVEVDIHAGWQAVKLATEVKAWQKRRDLARPMLARTVPGHDNRLPPPRMENLRTEVEPPPPPPDALANLVASATTEDELHAIWKQNTATWSQRHTELAVARKALITGGLV